MDAYTSHIGLSSVEGYGILIIRSIVSGCGWQRVNSGMINDRRDIHGTFRERQNATPVVSRQQVISRKSVGCIALPVLSLKAIHQSSSKDRR